MGLFGDKTQIQLDVAHSEVAAGQPVVARVRLGSPDKRAQGGRVELLYRNTYTEDYRDGDGDHETRTVTTDVVVDTQPLATGGGLRAGETVIELPLPRTAPGTSPNTVEWMVRAVVDRKLASDAEAKAPLVVRVPAQPLESWAQTPVVSPKQCIIGIDVASRIVRPGEQISGTMTLTPTSPVSARAARVRLRRVRHDKGDNKRDQVVQEVVVAEHLELAPGDTRTAAFALTVPLDAPPSFAAQHNQQRWYVEVVLDRKRALDYEGRLEVVVYNA